MKNFIFQIKRLFDGWWTGRQNNSLPGPVNNLPVCISAPTAVRQVDPPEVDDPLQQMESYLRQRYRLRFNLLTETPEFCPREQAANFVAIGQRELNSLCIELREQGLDCWDRDVHRFIYSCKVGAYHPIIQWMESLPVWDGTDRVRPLARRVSTDDAWINGFRRWMLGLAAQWMNLNELHANSVAPVLVSRRQGQHKSTFCKLLLPYDLQSYYTDHYDVGATGGSVQKLAVFGLINLDELDKYSDRKMAHLKNLIQMSGVNIRKAHQKGYSTLSRIASFIATSNHTDLLSDPTGSRRFLCVEVTEKIDTSPIDHAQLYAQLKHELQQGERYWFTTAEEQAIALRNAPFRRKGMDNDAFHFLFGIPSSSDEGQWITAARIFEHLKKHHPAAMRDSSPRSFGHTLIGLGLDRRHAKEGNEYRVVVLGK